MSKPKLREYTIQVQLTFVFCDTVYVTAASEEEAKNRAIEEAQCDWSKSEHTESNAFVVAVEEL